MKNRISQIFLLLIINLITISIMAQNNVGHIWKCNTVINEKDYDSFSISKSVVDYFPKYINVYVHVLRRDNGTGGLSQLQIDEWLSILCSDYINGNIVIRTIGQSNINSTLFYNGITDQNFNALINSNTQSNAINIYMLSPDDSFARASNIPGIALAIGGSFQGTSVLSHEFGHCLGLFHTHSGRGCYDYFNCAENIDGSNCVTCGDLICDTPADPCLSGNVNSNCEYIGNQSFNPDVLNIMSYSPPTCLSSLSSGQFHRIHYAVSNNQIFENRVFRSFLSGPTNLCASGGEYR